MKKRIWIMGLGMIGLAVLVVLVASAFQRSPRVPPPPVVGGQTARQAYTVLKTWITGWSGEAKVVAMSSSLSKATVGSGWTFQVYAPSSRRLAIVLVKGREVLVIREQAALYPQHMLDLESGVLDSDAVVSRWWHEYQGYAVWNSDRAHSLSLRLKPGQETLIWELSVIGSSNEQIAFWEISASEATVTQ